MQYITKLDRNKLEKYKKGLITEEVILTDERLYEHILLFHENEYKELRPYLKSIIDNPDYIIEDNRHEDTFKTKAERKNAIKTNKKYRKKWESCNQTCIGSR